MGTIHEVSLLPLLSTPHSDAFVNICKTRSLYNKLISMIRYSYSLHTAIHAASSVRRVGRKKRRNMTIVWSSFGQWKERLTRRRTISSLFLSLWNILSKVLHHGFSDGLVDGDRSTGFQQLVQS